MYEPIAIVGYGCLYPPDSFTLDKLYQNIMDGTDGIREINSRIWESDKYFNPDHFAPDKTYCKFSGYLDDIPTPIQTLSKMGVSVNSYEELNRTQQMVLHTILQAIAASGYSLSDIEDAGLFIGNMLGDTNISDYILDKHCDLYADVVNQYFEQHSITIHSKDWLDIFLKTFSEKINKKLSTNLFPSSLASQIADTLGMKQLSMVIDAACAGGLLVVDEAIKCLHQKKLDKCIVTGVLGNMGVSGNVAFSKIGGLSATGSHPLDQHADGLTPGEGAGTIIIKLLSDALQNGDTIFGIIRGSGVASDGSGQSIYAPSSKGQYAAIWKSLDCAHMTMRDIDYVEMHATGTPVGDKVEVRSILQLCEDDKIKKPIAIGSLKAQIGHSFSGAGMANLFKVLLSMNAGVLPPTHHFASLPKELGDVSPWIYVNAKAKKWETSGHAPRRALVNAFGFGGIDANILVEEFNFEYHKNLISKYQFDKDKTCRDKKYAIIGYGFFEEQPNRDASWMPIKENKASNKVESFVFPYIKFKIPPMIFNKLDEAQRLSLLAASNALDSSNIELPLMKTGVYSGGVFGLKNAYTSDIRIRSVEYTSVLRGILADKLSAEDYCEIENLFKSHFETIEEDTLPGFMDNIVAGRIANYFNTQGINATYDLDIGSFAAALHQGILSLNSKENDVIIVGGTNFNDLPAFEEIYRAFGSKSAKKRKGSCFFVIKREEDTSPDETIAYITEPQFVKTNILPYEDSKFDYIGATEAFVLLENILRSTEELDCIHYTTSSLTGRNFKFDIIPSKFNITQCAVNYNVIYTDAVDLIQLIQLLENALDSSENKNSVPGVNRQVAIIYKDKNDLIQQIELLKKLQAI